MAVITRPSLRRSAGPGRSRAAVVRGGAAGDCADRGRRTGRGAAPAPCARAGTTRRRRSTSRTPGCSSQRRTHSVSSAVRAGIGPAPAGTRSAVASSASTNGRGSASPAGYTRGAGQPAVPDDDDLPAARRGRAGPRPARGTRARAVEPLHAGGGHGRGRRAGRGASAASSYRCACGQPARSAPRARRTTGAASPRERARARRRRARRTPRRDSRPSHGAPHRPIPASAHARAAAACSGSRPVHWRSGSASCSAATAALGRPARAERAEVVRAVVADARARPTAAGTARRSA